MLLDTNILVYASKPGGDWLSPWTQHPRASLSNASRIEALGYSELGYEEESVIRSPVATCLEYSLDNEVIERAIVLRQRRSMSLGDSIIAATALEYGVPLVTRNTADFKDIAELTVIDPFAQG